MVNAHDQNFSCTIVFNDFGLLLACNLGPKLIVLTLSQGAVEDKENKSLSLCVLRCTY